MRNNLENNSAMLKSDALKRSSDSLSGNHESLSYERQNARAKQKKQKLIHEKITIQEHQKVDRDLMSKLSLLDVEMNNNEKSEDNKNKSSVEKDISKADQIKNYKELLSLQGKSQAEILKILISKFENDESVSVWVANWKSYLKLHKFAESKPLPERIAINRIISNAGFSNESAFAISLKEISNSSEISTQTKLEISREFDGTSVTSVNEMDTGLNQIKSQKKQIEKEIGVKSREKSSLQNDIDNLEDELENLSPDDPKRQELEKKLEQKKRIS
jgi:hypothetical protein